jgi:hypothetical protein
VLVPAGIRSGRDLLRPSHSASRSPSPPTPLPQGERGESRGERKEELRSWHNSNNKVALNRVAKQQVLPRTSSPLSPRGRGVGGEGGFERQNEKDATDRDRFECRQEQALKSSLSADRASAKIAFTAPVNDKSQGPAAGAVTTQRFSAPPAIFGQAPKPSAKAPRHRA